MIVIADIHLGKVNDSIVTEKGLSQTVDIRTRLGFILARAVKTEQCIVVAGDIFNRMNPTTQIISEFFSWLSECSSFGVQVFLLPGNHDAGVDWMATTMIGSLQLPLVTVFTGPNVVTISEYNYPREVLMWPHAPLYVQEQAERGHGSVSKWAASRFPDAEIIVTHGMVDTEYTNDIFFEAGNAMRVTPSDFKSLKLMVLGHIHNHTEGKGWVYPGSLTVNNFGEVDEKKGWVEVNLETAEHTWYEYPADVTPWVHIELDMTERDETCLDEETIKAVASGAIIKLTVLASAHGTINESKIRQMFNAYGNVSRFETVIAGSVTETSHPSNTLSHEQLLSEYLVGVEAKKEEIVLALKIGKEIITGVLA